MTRRLLPLALLLASAALAIGCGDGGGSSTGNATGTVDSGAGGLTTTGGGSTSTSDTGSTSSNETGSPETPPGGLPPDGSDETGSVKASEDRPIAVTSPKPLDVVVKQFTLAGTADVYEGTVHWKIEANGNKAVLQKGTLTASCGNGCIGTFSQDIVLNGNVVAGNYGLYVTDEKGGEGSQPFVVYIPLTVHEF